VTAYLAFLQYVTVGSLVATGNLASNIFNSLGNFSNLLMQVKSVEPIFEKFDCLEEERKVEKESLKDVTTGIHLRELSYTYGEKKVLNNVQASFSLGQKCAIVGASGTGKTTLLNILNGKLLDYTGSVTVSGKELKELDGHALREHILYLDQTPYIFDGSVRDNITLGENFTDEEIAQAIIGSDLAQMIEQLPQGLDTPVGEAGRSFSGGQKQRIALARGLVRGKKIILLDEGTSSLDEESALKIEENLLAHSELTVIMITHHLRDSIREKLDTILRLG
jgi:ABC-type bacteriocin/lantibiotic exporter with double-glycine peptidase domain